MLWNLVLKGVVVLAADVLGIGLVPTVINVVGVLTTVVTIITADDPQTEIRNVARDWMAEKVADRAVAAVVGAVA
jgi:hypothetical protein